METTVADGADGILAWFDAAPTLARSIAAAKRLARTPDPLVPVRCAILRNITLEPGIVPALAIACARRGLRATTYLGDFDNVQGDAFADDSPLYAARPELVILALRLHVLAPRLVHEFASLEAAEVARACESAVARVRSLLAAIRERSGALVLVHAFERPRRAAFGLLDRGLPAGQTATIEALNAALARAASETGALVVDLDAEIAEIGAERALDDRYWHLARAPYALALQTRLATVYASAAAALKGRQKKCLVLDCDNTLWGGVVGEDGIAGIALGPSAPGSAFVELHAAILDLYHRGVLLALASKNDERDALEVFERHPASLLKPHHFVAKRIDWNDKASNLVAIARELNIGTDALVFVDDNPVECALVRQRLPEVATIELSRDPSGFARRLRELPWFDGLALSDEDRRRSEMYRAEARRTELRETSGSMDDFLSTLEMTLTLAPARPLSLPRIAQLTQKTNQFNLTTRRYAESDVAAFASDPAYRVVSAALRDAFDDLGIVAVAISVDEGQIERVDTFLMSCRVIGRGVEAATIAALARSARARGKTALLGEFVATAKNGLAADFYERLGFAERPGSERRWWRLDLDGDLPRVPGWFREIVEEGAS